VQVFGNRGLTSGSGVAFSRDPSTGGPEPVIDFLFDAQGEDVVSGRRTPQAEAAVAQMLPDALAQLHDVLAQLEHHFGDVQDIEFTVEDGRFWVLQTRAAKRTPRAALRFAVDFVREGLCSAAEAVRRLDGIEPSALAVTRFADASTAIAKGIGAAVGVAVGRTAFDSAAAQQIAARGYHVILLRPDISTEDVAGFAASAGILTAAGGRTAHAAVVARQMGKPCIVGCKDLTVDAVQRQARLAGQTLAEGNWLSIDGGSGDIFLGQREIVTELPQVQLDQINRWRAELWGRKTA
jgi:pyruvate,orthophosphate dikinase